MVSTIFSVTKISTQHTSAKPIDGIKAVIPVFLALFLSGCDNSIPTVVNVNDDAFAGGQLNVINYNMLHPGPIAGKDNIADTTMQARFELLVAQIVAEKPDLLLLQEASDTGKRRFGNIVDELRIAVNIELNRESISYNSAWLVGNKDPTGITGFSEGEAILSRYKITNESAYTYEAQAVTVIKEKRRALLATIQGDPTNIDVVVVHLKGDFADQQIKEVLGLIEPSLSIDKTTIIAGDFNQSPSTVTIGTTMANSSFSEMWGSIYPGDDGFTSMPGDVTQPTNVGHERIDYIFVSEGTQMDAVELFLGEAINIGSLENENWLWGSDHIGLKGLITPAGF